MFADVSRLAARQHGRVAVRQLRALGVDAQRTRRWVRDGRLHPIHLGVYAVGHPGRSAVADYMAAVLACGAGAVLSHLAAAFVLAIVRCRPSMAQITVPTTASRARPGIVVHRVRHLDERDLTTFNAIPMTTVPRVLLDIAPNRTPAELARDCHEAWIRHRTGPRQIEDCIARNPGKPGARLLRAALGTDVTLSVLEDGFLDLLDRHRLPRPRTNVVHGGDTVDCHWPDRGLTVELLSYRFHGTRQAFEADVARRRRSNHLAFTYGDVFQRPARTAAEIAAALRLSPAAAPTASPSADRAGARGRDRGPRR